MARTTYDLVIAVIEVDADDYPNLDQFIRPASHLIRKVVEPKTTFYDLLDAEDIELLTEIETWLAGHFFAITEARREDEKADVVSQKIESKVDLHLDVTRWGQQALILDVSGALAELNAKAKQKLKAREEEVPDKPIVFDYLGDCE